MPLVTYDGDGEVVSRTGANVADRVRYRAGGGIADTVSVGIGQQQLRVIVPQASGKRQCMQRLRAGHQFKLHGCTASLNLLCTVAGNGNPN